MHYNSKKMICFSLLLSLFIYLFIYFWLHWVFVAARGLSLAVLSRGYSLSQARAQTPTMAGRFLTTAPPGKSLFLSFAFLFKTSGKVKQVQLLPFENFMNFASLICRETKIDFGCLVIRFHHLCLESIMGEGIKCN